MHSNDDRPGAGGDGADDQIRESGWLPGFDVTPSAAGVNLAWLSKHYRNALDALSRTFAGDYAAFEAVALELIAEKGETSGDATHAELKRRTGLKRNHYWRCILARVFRHRSPSLAAKMRVRRSQLDRQPERFWSERFPR